MECFNERSVPLLANEVTEHAAEQHFLREMPAIGVVSVGTTVVVIPVVVVISVMMSAVMFAVVVAVFVSMTPAVVAVMSRVAGVMP